MMMRDHADIRTDPYQKPPLSKGYSTTGSKADAVRPETFYWTAPSTSG